ncbi:MAG: MoaD/ThiS family protein [Dehalococcoidales bacterium]|nr:MoaD/ThiS family protein [Dehalococcoidales bacterium]
MKRKLQQRLKGKVYLQVLPLLAETLGMPETSEMAISEETGGVITVRDLLNRLGNSYKHFDYLFDIDTQKLSGKVNIFFNGCDLELLDGLETRLSDGDTLTFVWVIPGG